MIQADECYRQPMIFDASYLFAEAIAQSLMHDRISFNPASEYRVIGSTSKAVVSIASESVTGIAMLVRFFLVSGDLVSRDLVSGDLEARSSALAGAVVVGLFTGMGRLSVH